MRFTETGQSFLAADKGEGWKEVKAEADARKKVNFEVSLYDALQVRTIIGSEEYYGAVRYTNTYGIDALKYAQSMKKILLENNVEIYEASEVIAIKGHTVHTHLGSVTADQIIFCADKLKENVTKHAWNTYHAQTFLSISIRF